MKYLYIILLAGSFLMGWYDNEDITFFALMLFFGVAAGTDKLVEKIRERVRN